MKKIIHILILSIVVMAFLAPKTGDIQATKAEQQQVSNQHAAHMEFTAQPATGEDSNWIIECVDCPNQFDSMGDHFMQLDAEGHPHVAYGGDHLYYAWYDGAEWHYKTVDSSPNVGQSASLALDINGYPHISYLDTYNNNLLYAFQDGDGWHTQTVDNGGDVGWYTSIAVDGNGYPHISYKNEDMDYVSDLKYAFLDSSGWQTSVLDKDVRGTQSIALDAAGFPHIGYFGGEDYNLRYQHKDATSWYIETVDSDVTDGTYLSMVMGTNGNTHIAYCRISDYELKFAVRDTQGWHSQTTEFGICGSISLALDLDDGPRISNYDRFNGQLIYTSRDSDGWHHQIVANVGGGWIGSISLDLTTIGAPYIFYSGTNQGLRNYYWTPDGWNFQVVDTVGSVSDAMMVLGENDFPHFSYIYQSAGTYSVNYAYKDMTGWNIIQADEIESTNIQKPLLALDHQGQSHIIYKQESLKYVYQDRAGWNIRTLPITDAEILSFVVDDKDQAHITYYDDTSQADVSNTSENTYYEFSSLNYAYFDNYSWHTTSVTDCLEIVGPFPGLACNGGALAIDKEGYPHIFYTRDQVLEYAHKDSSGWQGQNLGFAFPVHGYSIALDDNDFPHISFQQNESVKYIYQDSEAWHLGTVVENGSQLSLDLDVGAYPHILYKIVDDENYSCELMYTFKTKSGWQLEELEIMSCTASLTLDKHGIPHINYEEYADWASNLYYAHKKFSYDGQSTIYLPILTH
jgi:hypothetical protein